MQKNNQSIKTICFIVNSISGPKQNKGFTGVLEKEIDKTRYGYIVSYTKSAGHAKHLAKEAVENKTDIVVAVGGDGTINEVASALIDTDIILGIIPAGSGNGLARHIGIPRSLEKAIGLINEGHFLKIDTASVNGKPFISIAGIGFDALVAEQFAENKKRGFFSYFRIVAKEFLKYKPEKYTIRFDDGTLLSAKSLMVSFANSNQFGYNTTIAPNAKLNDGKLDVCIVEKPPLYKLPIIANLVLLKRIDRSSHVRIIPSTGLSLEREVNRVVNVDGEPVILTKNLNIQIKPLTLKVIVPKYGKI